MRILLSSAEPEEARIGQDVGAAGVFADPTALAKAGPEWRRKLTAVMNEIEGPVYIQATEQTTERILAQFDQFQRLLDERMVATICISDSGMAAARTLQDALIPTNITAVVTFNQAVVAAQSGADYVSVCFGQADNECCGEATGTAAVIEAAAAYIQRHGLDVRIIATDVRDPDQFRASALSGAHFAAVPAGLIATILTDARSEQIAAECAAAWKSIRAIK
ncbi:MAG: hypothetical protein EA403_12190 [Spirochaetaceae bacterium]|nr:MAG: hypothetical protein EA403_12190 [Spirochaetaceae bacterium]